MDYTSLTCGECVFYSKLGRTFGECIHPQFEGKYVNVNHSDSCDFGILADPGLKIIRLKE